MLGTFTEVWREASCEPLEGERSVPGDSNLPHTVAYVLAGEERASEERMLDLLEPYRGHRFRVIRLLWMNGVSAPRRGPREDRV